VFKIVLLFVFFIVCLPARGENVVLILMDDMGYGYLKANLESQDKKISPDILKRDGDNFPYEKVATQFTKAMPTLNSMVDNGVHFTDAYTTSPLCGPSRLSILTGKNNASFGIYNNIDVNQTGLPKDIIWPVETLSSHYYSVAIGKWHARSNRYDLGDDPITAGFDEFYGFVGHGTPYYESDKIHRYNPSSKVFDKVTQAPGEYLTEVFTDETLAAINKHTFNKPLFVYLSYNAIHGPLGKEAPKKYSSKFKTGNDNVDTILSYLNAVDEGIKNIQAELKAKGELENTVFMFLADNGSPGGKSFAYPSNSPFAGFKGQILHGGLRVPMIAYQKGKTTGTVYQNPVSSMDLMATVMDYAGMPPESNGLHGRSLMNVIKGSTSVVVHKNIFVVGQNAVNFSYIKPDGESDRKLAPGSWLVRNKKWVLLYTADDQYLETGIRSGDNYEHYGLYKASDVHLTTNLYDKKPNLANRMKEDFFEWFEANKAEPVKTAEHPWWEEVHEH